MTTHELSQIDKKIEELIQDDWGGRSNLKRTEFPPLRARETWNPFWCLP